MFPPTAPAEHHAVPAPHRAPTSVTILPRDPDWPHYRSRAAIECEAALKQAQVRNSNHDRDLQSFGIHRPPTSPAHPRARGGSFGFPKLQRESGHLDSLPNLPWQYPPAIRARAIRPACHWPAPAWVRCTPPCPWVCPYWPKAQKSVFYPPRWAHAPPHPAPPARHSRPPAARDPGLSPNLAP